MENEIPLGLGMALSQNLSAMQIFSAMSPDERNQVIAQAHQVGSREEMQSLVQRLSG